MKRNVNIDVLKIIACVAVVVLHSCNIICNRSYLSYSFNYTLYYLAAFAMPIFFMVNGNLLLNKPMMNYQYVLKKIARILFVVFAWNMIWFIAKILLDKEWVNPFYDTFLNFIQEGYYWHFWFLGSLILIYLVLPILYKYFNKSIKYAVIMTAVFFAASVIIDIINIILSLYGYKIIQHSVTQTYRLWTWFFYYLLGGLIGKEQVKEAILKRFSFRSNLIILVVTSVITNLYQYFVGVYLFDLMSPEYYFGNILIIVWDVSIFMMVYRLDFSHYKGKTVNLIGRNVMGIYILHTTVIKYALMVNKFDTVFSNIALIFIAFAGSLVASEIISRIPVLNKLIKL